MAQLKTACEEHPESAKPRIANARCSTLIVLVRALAQADAMSVALGIQAS